MSTLLKEKLKHKIERLKENPESGNVLFKAGTELVNGTLTNATIRKFNFNIDEPKELGGNDIAPNPVELVLAALGTCQEIIYSAYATVLDIRLNAVKVDVKGWLDLNGLFGTRPGVNSGFNKIEFETYIDSDEPKEKINQLVSLVEKHCPVLDTLTRAVNVEGTIKITNNSIAA